MDESVALGKIVKSDSHVRYLCQIYGPGEVAAPPHPADFAFGQFVRLPLRAESAPADVALLSAPGAPGADALTPATSADTWAVGVICDTILVNPAYGTLGPRLSNDDQVELFSPDYLTERAVLTTILLLGVMVGVPAGQNGRSRMPTSASARMVRHGVPPIAPDLGAVVATLPESEVRAFHFFADGGSPGGAHAYLHMGYLPHIIALNHPLLPMAVLQIVEQLQVLFPDNAALLSIMQRNFAWRLKVQTAG